ncbi:Integrase, catalytic core [Hirsutella rhossiliensis]
MGMGREIEDQMKLETWTKVARKMVEEAGHFIIPLRWVYAYKLDEQGYVTRFKARLVDRAQKKLWLAQASYLSKMAKKFHIEDDDQILGVPQIPITTEELKPYEKTATRDEVHQYLSLIGSILHPAIHTRPDGAFPVGKLAQFSHNPGPKHRREARRCLAYLYHTRDRCICFSVKEAERRFLCASDSSFADNPETRKSSQGYVFLFLGGPVDWKATKQATVTTSSTEAELLALSSAAKEQMQFSRLIKELDIKVEGTNELWCDNLQTIRLLTELSAKLKTNLKHIDIHRHWLRQEVQEERLQITWIKSTENPADGMTKPFPAKARSFCQAARDARDRWHQLKPMRRRTVSTVSPPREI